MYNKRELNFWEAVQLYGLPGVQPHVVHFCNVKEVEPLSA